jgi:hypothetical protein
VRSGAQRVTVLRLLVAAVVFCNAFEAAGQTTGSINISFSAAGGTQSRRDVSGQIDLGFKGGTDVPRQTRVRFEGAYGTAQKPDQAKVVATDWYYGELRHSVDARRLFGGDNQTTDLYLYGVASAFHQLAFDLELEQAYGVGLMYDVRQVPGLAVSADLRYIHEQFGAQDDFSSWAIRMHQSYSHTWTVAAGTPGERIFTFGQSVEITPAFESADALQMRTGLSFGIPLVSNWSMPIAFGSEYMRNVSDRFKRHYWKTSIGVTYTFGG